MQGKNATNINNYDDRKFQEYFINNLKFAPDIAVIGSSRSFSIDAALFPNKKFINLSVSRASIYDFVALYELLKINNRSPKRLILSVDPWVFNESNHHSRWQTLEKYYEHFKGKEYKRSIDWVLIQQAFSLSYFQESFFEINKKLHGIDQPIPTDKLYNESNTKLPDGSLIYRGEIRNGNSTVVKRKSKKYLLGDNYGLSNYFNHSKDLVSDFKLLLEDAKENQIEIIIFLAPFNPFIYQDLQANFPMLQKTEKLIHNIGTDYNIRIIGSFDPRHHNLDLNAFYDGLHLRRQKIDSLFKNGYEIN